MKIETLLENYFERIVADDEVYERQHGKKPVYHNREYPYLKVEVEYIETDKVWMMSHYGNLVHRNIPEDAIHPLINYLNDLEVVAKDLSDIQSLTQKVINKYEKKNIHHR